MVSITRLVLAIFILSASIAIYRLMGLLNPPKLPKVELNKYWGSGDGTNYTDDTELIGNRLFYEQEIIDKLVKKLNETIPFHEPLEGIAFENGFNVNYLKKIVRYWRDEYLPIWRSREIYLWRWPHLTTYVQGLFMHYLHTRYDDPPKGKKVFPLLLLHGWPSSVREFYDEMPFLIENEEGEYSFEVVVPSIPGHVWSSGSSKPGFGAAEVAVVLRNLMLRLGYKKFFIQASGEGSHIGAIMAQLFPEMVLGYYSTACTAPTPMAAIKTLLASYFPSYFASDSYDNTYSPLLEKFTYFLDEAGLLQPHLMKPDTAGIGLTENPIGLAVFILDELSSKTNPNYEKLEDGGLENISKLNGLLDSVMVYYLTNSITTAQRFRAETRKAARLWSQMPITVPAGCGRFKNDRFHQSDWILKDKFLDLIHSSYNSNGGRFVAFERPDLLYNDFIIFVDKVVKKYKL